MDVLMTIAPWAGFLALVGVLLAIDLGVFHREAHEVGRREALVWSIVWIGLALIFNAGVYLVRGFEDGLRWTTGYIVEKSLSVDNIFVFVLIFSAFAVPTAYQHRVLFWGIVGALVMRAILIAFAGFLLSTLHFTVYLFGAFLVFTGIRFLREEQHEPDLRRSRVLRLARRIFPVTDGYRGQKFFVREHEVRYATPLFLVLIFIEMTDLAFAVDSVPAIYAITDDPFIVFTSNIFAILGLRALYFVVAGYLRSIALLRPALAVILVFVGGKMLASDFYKVPPAFSLAFIVSVLVAAVVGSALLRRREAAHPPTPAGGPGAE